jgi:hypothetical protein
MSGAGICARYTRLISAGNAGPADIVWKGQVPMTHQNNGAENEENTFQPDPLLRHGRARNLWIWATAAIAIVAIALILFVTGGSEQVSPPHESSYQGPPMTTGSGNTPPAPVNPAGRGTSDAPPVGQSRTNAHP